MFKAIIFDRDGTLNRTTKILRPGQKPGDRTDGYVLCPDELELFPAVRPAFTLLRRNGVQIYVFTQQNCVAKGLVTEEGVNAVHARMNALLGPEAAVRSFHLACAPDSPRAKPSPAMILEILEQNGLGRDEVLVAGDSMRDYKSALAAGTAYAWIRDDFGRVAEKDMQATGCPVFDNVLELAQKFILAGQAVV